jgi:hypothetical protein
LVRLQPRVTLKGENLVLGRDGSWTPGCDRDVTKPHQRGPDDWWTIEVWLPSGEYAYLFLVDGVPWNDPLDDGRRANVWGGDYSLRTI